MGKFADELKKAMTERNVGQTDIEQLADGKITQAGISAIFKKDSLPRLEAIDLLADILKRPKEKFREYALFDTIERELNRFGKTWKDIMPGALEDTVIKHRIPVYNIEDLKDSLSIKGYPVKKTDFTTSTDLKVSHHAYAVAVNSHILSPRVLRGEIAILSTRQDKQSIEDYGVIRTKRNLFIGRIIEGRSQITIETKVPYDISRLAKKDILFIHKIILIKKRDIPDSQ